MDLAYEPGAKTVYSDLGIILLGDILERVSGTPFEDLARKRVLEPLAMKDSRYRPPAALLDRIAPTENDPWRGRVVRGEVHDENAFALGGVAPHAGLFGTAPDLAHLAQALLDGGVFGGRRIVSRATVELFTERAGIPVSLAPSAGTRPPTNRASAARRRGSRATRRRIALLGPVFRSHRLHRHLDVDRPAARALRHPAHEPRAADPRNDKIRDTRHIADAAVARSTGRETPGLPGRDRPAARGPALARRPSRVIMGSSGSRPTRARRCGAGAWACSAHAVSVTADATRHRRPARGRVDVVRLFGPEHGLRGRAAAGQVRGGLDAASGLPVVSLYGARRSPPQEDLRGLDVLVVDLQDAGVRFYAYAARCCSASRPRPSRAGSCHPGPAEPARRGRGWRAERDPAMAFSLVSVAPGPSCTLDAGRDGALATGLSSRGAPCASVNEPRGS